MHGQLTQDAIDALTNSPSAVMLSLATLGDAFNYIPSQSQANQGIQGNLIFQTAPSAPAVQNANIIRYSVYLDFNLGPFYFGEVALTMDNGQPFGLFVSDVLINKFNLAQAGSNSIRIDIFVSMVDGNFDAWMDLAETNNMLQVARAHSPDQLPPPQNARPNIYVIPGATQQQSSFLAYTDRQGLWSYQHYDFTDAWSMVITSRNANTVTVSIANDSADLILDYIGQLLLQFSTGPLFGISRYVTNLNKTTTSIVLTLSAPLADLPNVGDTLLMYRRDPRSTTNVTIPIATTSTLGVVIVGDSLKITPAGVLDVDPEGLPFVQTVDDIGPDADGNVDLNLAAVARSGRYSDLIGAPGEYELPTAGSAVKGGVRIMDGFGLFMDGQVLKLSFTPILTVNGVAADANNNVNVHIPIGLVDPAAIPAGANFNDYRLPGLFYALTDPIAQGLSNGPGANAARRRGTLEVVPLNSGLNPGLVMQRWTQDNISYWRTGDTAWSAWVSTAGTIPIATTSSLGGVIVGENLAVNPAGVLSVAKASDSVFGVVKIGDGLYITTVTEELTLQAATSSQLGGVKVGPMLFINENGQLESRIKTVAGQSPDPVSGNIELTAAHVGAIAIDARNAWNGVPTINPLPPEGDGAVTRYEQQRMLISKAPIGSWVYIGEWDADTNECLVDYDGETRIITLEQDGKLIDSSVSPLALDANGKIFRVSVPGTTALDNVSFWTLGDLAISVGGEWLRFRSTISRNDYQVAVYAPAGIQTSEPLFFMKTQEQMIIQASSYHSGIALVAPNGGDVVLPLQLNGTTIGNVTFVNGSLNATINVPTPVNVNPGDEFAIIPSANGYGVSGVSIIINFTMRG